MPHLGNGQIGGIVAPDGLSMQRLFLATAHSDGTDGTNVSTVIPVTIPVNLSFPGIDLKVTKQKLLMREGAFVTQLTAPGITVSCRLSASRALPEALVAEVSISASRRVNLLCVNTPDVPQSLTTVYRRPQRVWCEDGGVRLFNTLAAYGPEGDQAIATSSVIIPGGVSQTLISADSLRISMQCGDTAHFSVVGAVASSIDWHNVAAHAERQAIYAENVGIPVLSSRHRLAWDRLWKYYIDIEGDSTLQRQVDMALYSIYSSILPGSRRSIPPMGLTSSHYSGHIFWDADTWMLPVLCIMQPRAARDMVDYRIDRLPVARANALSMGYEGAMFPWESDFRGEESTPTFALTGPLEHHITADVARGAWLYFCTSADTTWLIQHGEPLIRACADFWTSRVRRNADGSYSIPDVVGADEYAIGVTDNAFTNAAARRCLEYAIEAAATTHRKVPEEWDDIATNLTFHRTPDGVIAEYAGFTPTTIKQADVALLAYPLGLIVDPQEVRRTLDYYEPMLDTVAGPSMSHSAMAVNYARSNQPEKASHLVKLATEPYLRGEYLMMAETPSNDATYFITGAGGLLQAVLMGYLGLDITTDGIRQIPSSLPPGVTSLTAVTPHGTFTRHNRIR